MNRKKIIGAVIALLLLTACSSDNGSGKEKTSEPPGQTQEIIQIKESPDKYTAYLKNYVGRNCASIGYESLGGDRNDEIGNGYIHLIMITEDGTYAGIDDESLKDYVVVAQSYAPNTEIKFIYETDSEGKEYDNLIEWQNIKEVVLKVKKVGSNEKITNKGMTPISIPSDKYTAYVKDYVGRNLANCGYVSLGGEYRDEYAATNILLTLITDDGSYIDLEDSESLQNYYVTAQNPSPNTEIRFEYETDSNGKEYSFTRWESLTEIELYVTSLGTAGTSSATGQDTGASDNLDDSFNDAKNDLMAVGSEITGELAGTAKDALGELLPETVQEPQSSEPAQQEAATVSSANSTGYEAIYNDYAQRLRNATPVLINEYNLEKQSNTEGISGLAKILNNKIEKQAELLNEGIGELAKYYFSNSSGSYDEYEEWADKLYDVYMEEADKLYDVYMESV